MHPELTRLQPEFKPSFERYAHSIRIDALDDVLDQVKLLFEVASERLNPCAIIRPTYIDTFKTEGDLSIIEIEGQRFEGKALGVLHNIHRVFPYVATCGDGMESFDFSEFDMFAPYWLDAIKMQALGAARRAILEYCKERYHMSRPMSLNPGSGNVDIWPIQEQVKLFSLLDDGVPVGVRLTESSLMVPNKSISGLFFTSPDVDYESCAYCERFTCPDRRVPFVNAL
jgi:hypothetical protein